MRLKIVYLLFMQSAIIFSSCFNQNRNNVDSVSADTTNVSDFQSAVKTVKTDSISEMDATNVIKTFYQDYTTAIISSESYKKSDSLKTKYLTKSLLEKIDKIVKASDADPIIRGQDFREDVIKTLDVKHLEDNWYMVSYIWDKDTTNIPVRVSLINSQYMIDYIIPFWHGTHYGDSLLNDDFFK